MGKNKKVPKATIQLIWTRYLTARKNRPLYVQQANVAEDFALRLLRWSAVSLHPKVLRAVTDRPVAAHIIKWRAYRNGWTKYNEQVQEKVLEEVRRSQNRLSDVWTPWFLADKVRVGSRENRRHLGTT